MKMPWTKTRHILENDFICDSLKGRIRYFATRYRNAHDSTGRVCILVDRQEVLSMPFQNENIVYAEAHKRLDESQKTLFQLSMEITQEFHQNGKFRPYDFGNAVDIYLSQTIEISLRSNDLLVRMLAVLDRRVGKRTLQKMKAEIPTSPEWLQYFYKLRLESENLL